VSHLALPRPAVRRLVAALAAPLLVLLTVAATPAPAAAGPAGRQGPPLSSGVTSVEVLSRTPLTLAGREWVRTAGVVRGAVDPREPVAGLADQPTGHDGRFVWSSEFELIAPAASTGRSTVLVEAENRGAPLFLGALHSFSPGTVTPTKAAYPAGIGNGFLFEQGISYARVQWQTGISAGVPATAQGVGEVIVRDFGRLLSRSGPSQARGTLPTYTELLLAGVSQSAWFVNTLVAEGFNADPRSGRGVFDGAIAVDGNGGWLAINQLAAGAPQTPYVLPNGVPLTLGQLLSRPKSDPVFVDVANYTDYYRLRASVSLSDPVPDGAFRYDWPSPHAGPSFPDAVVFGVLRCNDGVVVPRNPISYQPYLRTVVAQLAETVRSGGGTALPPSAVFELQATPPPGTGDVNELPGLEVLVPSIDPDTAQPLGGVPFAEAALPLGRPRPVALSPVGTRSINDLCGNWGGWQPFSAAELDERYGSVSSYLVEYAALLDDLIATDRLRAEERAGLLAAAERSYLAAPA